MLTRLEAAWKSLELRRHKPIEVTTSDDYKTSVLLNTWWDSRCSDDSILQYYFIDLLCLNVCCSGHSHEVYIAGDHNLPNQSGWYQNWTIILAPQWAAVVNIYRSGLVSGATPYPAPLQILTLCGIMLFLVLEQLEYFLVPLSSSKAVSLTGLSAQL